MICPNCQSPIEIHQTQWPKSEDGTLRVECPKCQSPLQLTFGVRVIEKMTQSSSPPVPARPAPARSAGGGGRQAGSSVPHPQTSPQPPAQVAVAVDGEASRELIREILVEAGYEVLEAATGREALSLLEKHRPPLAVLDVGLPQMFGFEVCEVIKRQESLKSLKVILVASIHDKNTYKREPRTLYGADDYIERHRLQEDLIPKVQTLLNIKIEDAPKGQIQKVSQELPVSQPAPLPKAEKPSLTKPKESSPPQVVETTKVSPEHEAARRLARIIVSDIALYNPDRVEEAMQRNSFYEMLKDEIEEGRKLYNERVSATVRSNTDYFQNALENFIKSKTRP